MDKSVVKHHLVGLIDGDDMLKRASVADLVAVLRELADTAEDIFKRGVGARISEAQLGGEANPDMPRTVQDEGGAPPVEPGCKAELPGLASARAQAEAVELAPVLPENDLRGWSEIILNRDRAPKPPPLPVEEPPPPLPPDAFRPRTGLPPDMQAQLDAARAAAADEPYIEGGDDDEPDFEDDATEPPNINWTEEQRAALDEIDAWHGRPDYSLSWAERVEQSRNLPPFFALTGPAGTGKSTLMREVARRYPSATLTAMTGKAALRLRRVTGCEAGTLHSTMYWPPKPGEDLRFTRLRDTPGGIVLVDEASMISPSIFADLQRWGVRAILVGDSFQLPPVITGEELKNYGEDYSIFTHVRGAELKTVMRNAGGILRAATHVRETGELLRQSDPDEKGGYEYARETDPMVRAVDEYLADRDDHMLVTWKNSVRMRANRMIRERLGHDGPLPDDGEPVLIKKNGQGFLNGEIVPCAGFSDGPVIGADKEGLGGIRTLWMKTGMSRLLVTVQGGPEDKGGEWFDGGRPWVRNFRSYHIDLTKQALPEPQPITWGYVGTAHSFQGNEARRVTVFLERGDTSNRNFRKPTTLPSGQQVSFSARWLYTATTRGRERALMIEGR